MGTFPNPEWPTYYIIYYIIQEASSSPQHIQLHSTQEATPGSKQVLLQNLHLLASTLLLS